MEINKRELNNIRGGTLVSKFIIVGGVITFIIGIIDGFFRPKRCN